MLKQINGSFILHTRAHQSQELVDNQRSKFQNGKFRAEKATARFHYQPQERFLNPGTLNQHISPSQLP